MRKLTKFQIWKFIIFGVLIVGIIGIGFYIGDKKIMGASVIQIFQGGTGTSTKPTINRMLLSDTNGNWEYVATSTLGITADITADAWSVHMAATTTDALDVGTTNLYWTNNLFDVRLTATTTLSKLTTLAGLSSIGTITTGVWNGTAIGTGYGGTGQDWSAVAAGSLPYFSSSGGMTTLAGGSANNVLTYSGTAPQWSSSLTISSLETGTLYVSGSVNQGDLLVSPGDILTGDTATSTIKGDNATSTFSNKISSITGDFFVSGAGITDDLILQPWVSTGKVGIGTTSPSSLFSVNGATYTTGNITSDGIFTSQNTGTSTFGGGSFSLLSVTATNATSTFSNGINLTAGCFSIAGTCVGGGGSGTINSGTTNRLAYYSGATTLDSANYLRLDIATSRLGIATTSPAYDLDVFGDLRIDPDKKLIIPLLSGLSLTDNGSLGIDTSDKTLEFRTGGTTYKLNPRWYSDRANISDATTTDEVEKIGGCLEDGITVTIDKVLATVASSTATTGIYWNINIADKFSSTSPMTLFTNNANTSGGPTDNAKRTYTTGFDVSTIPAGYCYWWKPVTASTTQIQNFQIQLYGYEQ